MRIILDTNREDDLRVLLTLLNDQRAKQKQKRKEENKEQLKVEQPIEGIVAALASDAVANEVSNPCGLHKIVKRDDPIHNP